MAYLLLEVSKKYEKSAGLSSGKYVGLKLAKSVSNIQFQLVIIIFSNFISPWQTPNYRQTAKHVDFYYYILKIN